jgi:hypothetical protein
MRIGFKIFLIYFLLNLTGCEMFQPDKNRAVSAYTYFPNLDNDIVRELNAVKIGMSQTDVIGSLGNPSGNNVSRTAAGKSEQWIYTGQDLVGRVISNQGIPSNYNGLLVTPYKYENVRVYLYFENGILTKTDGF